MLRAGDSRERIIYSLAATFLGRMCLSGDIHDLSDEQWKLVSEGIEFYKKAADIIKNGCTILQEYTTNSYNNPQGSQLVLREWKNMGLAVFHRFDNSEDMDLTRLENKNILDTLEMLKKILQQKHGFMKRNKGKDMSREKKLWNEGMESFMETGQRE